MTNENTDKPVDIIKVMVYSTSPVFSDAVSGLLNGQKDIVVSGNVSDRSALLEFLYESEVDIAIIHDRTSSRTDTLDLVRMIRVENETVRPLILFDDYNSGYELAALEAGVRGFLPEARIKTDIVKCIRAMNSGEIWARRAVMGEFVTQLFVKLNKGEYLSPTAKYFTKKELEIIVLANKGLKNKQIANRLSMSEKTVKYHLSNVFKKLNIKKRSEIKEHF